MTFDFTIEEQAACHYIPEVIRALAEWHGVQATLADAMDYPRISKSHSKRMIELLEEAARVEVSWDLTSEKL